MKLFCSSCTLHFPDEFEQTLKPSCMFWQTFGLANIPKKLKVKIWKAFHTFPYDELVTTCDLSFSVSLSVHKVNKESMMENNIEGYMDMNDQQRKEAQREYFRKKNQEQQAKKEAEDQSRGVGFVPDLSYLITPRKDKTVN